MNNSHEEISIARIKSLVSNMLFKWQGHIPDFQLSFEFSPWERKVMVASFVWGGKQYGIRYPLDPELYPSYVEDLPANPTAAGMLMLANPNLLKQIETYHRNLMFCAEMLARQLEAFLDHHRNAFVALVYLPQIRQYTVEGDLTFDITPKWKTYPEWTPGLMLAFRNTPILCWYRVPRPAYQTIIARLIYEVIPETISQIWGSQAEAVKAGNPYVIWGLVSHDDIAVAVNDFILRFGDGSNWVGR